MIALLDINIPIALFDAAHVHHQAAHTWMARSRIQGWAPCPITQNGFVHVISQPQYPGRLPVSEALCRLGAAITTKDHHFWADSVSLCDGGRFNPEWTLSSRNLTDIYLLGLAAENGGRLVTFDRGIALGAVAGAKTRHLLVL